MIPKVIHYCWFGGKKKSKLIQKCIKSWHKYCPDYKIIEWNENNYDISTAPLFVRQAINEKKWAFATDYIRYQIIFENGGIYLDTDVELIRNLDGFLHNLAFFSFEKGKDFLINSGLGFGAEKGTELLGSLMNLYKNQPFVLPNRKPDLTPCPLREKDVFLSYGIIFDGTEQIIDGNIHIYSLEYFCPLDYYEIRERPLFYFNRSKQNITDKTVSIHWFSHSWKTSSMNRNILKSRLYKIPIEFLKIIMGMKLYRQLRDFLWKKISRYKIGNVR